MKYLKLYLTSILAISLLITLGQTAVECDTLHYPLDGTPTLFYATDGGFVCGNNFYGDLAKADFFQPQDTGRLLYHGFFDFAYVGMGSGQDPNIDFRVW